MPGEDQEALPVLLLLCGTLVNEDGPFQLPDMDMVPDCAVKPEGTGPRVKVNVYGVPVCPEKQKEEEDTGDTVTAVQAPQLLPSLLSVIVPLFEAELLSAQARTYQVPVDGNVYERLASALAPDARADDCVCVPISVVFAPAALVARWNRFVKPAPVEAFPELLMVA
jgi:hypothetical protein